MTEVYAAYFTIGTILALLGCVVAGRIGAPGVAGSLGFCLLTLWPLTLTVFAIIGFMHFAVKLAELFQPEPDAETEPEPDYESDVFAQLNELRTRQESEKGNP